VLAMNLPSPDVRLTLTSLSYRQGDGSGEVWSFDALRLDELNLIVGKNATGKSRVLRVISGIAQCIAGRTGRFGMGEWSMAFSDSAGHQWRYEVSMRASEVSHEALWCDEAPLLSVGLDGTGTIFNAEAQKHLKTQAPTDRLLVNAKQDALQHPFIEPLMGWAEGVHHILFGSSMAKDNAFLELESAQSSQLRPSSQNPNEVVALLRDGQARFGANFTSEIVSDMVDVGFPLAEVKVLPMKQAVVSSAIDAKLLQVHVVEDGVSSPLNQTELSQGMWRSLCTIILLHYALRAERPSILLVDDIGEGLDYERASGLIQTIMRRVKDSQTQVVFTSNDRQVMNAVPLEAWHVLMRKGGKVTIYDKHNAADRFADFKYTGLNNFDLLSSGFLEEGVVSAEAEIA
jgi:energy-coupling factor transporter ATP-binding protein EcfA2